MAGTFVRERLLITSDSRPLLPSHIKLRYDNARRRWIILAPERVFDPDDTAVAVLRLADGQRSVAAIVAALARDYEAPVDEIRTDVMAMLQDLADKGVMTANLEQRHERQ
ncbi:MAG: pyrroloquinoline quinone biosynthesis peptide chaperone PqqD [Hyphomicrobium sp.]